MTPRPSIALAVLGDLIEQAERDQRTNRMSRVSDVTLQWLYAARDRIAKAEVETSELETSDWTESELRAAHGDR